MVDLTKPIYGDIWANAGETLNPGATKIATGWIQEMMPYQFENFLQNRTDIAISYLLQKGIPEWSADQEYTANKSVVTYGSQLYMATATTTNVLPTVSASWKRLTISLGVNGAVPVSFGGTGATNAADARANLGIGTSATADFPVANGLISKLADNTLVVRAITGTTGYITVTNGDGVSGNPTINVGANVARTDTDTAWTTTGSIRLPSGSTSEQGIATPGRVRYNLETGEYYGAYSDGWKVLSKPATAEQTTIIDAGNYYTSSNVEGALQEVGGITKFVKNAILSYPDYTSTSAAAATLPDGQVVVADADEVRGVVSAGSITQEQSIYKVADYAKIRNYTGRGTRLRVVDPTGAHWWVRKGTASDNGGTFLKDGFDRSWVREYSGSVNVLWFGAVGDGVADDTVAIQAAIDYAASVSAVLEVPGGIYKLVPATSVAWEGGTFLAALIMRSNMHIRSDRTATFKIADGVSTDAAPVHHQMFFSNQVLSNVSMYGLIMNMNGQNNKISPNRAIKDFNRFMNAQICVSGTPGGVAARIDRCTIEWCVFQNNNGVSCIVAGQSNTVGAGIGTYWNILFNDFEEVGLDTDDHSSIFGRFTKSRIIGNRMVNSTPFSPTTGTGGLCAIEMHASDNVCALNHVENYFQFCWISANFTEAITRNVIVTNNTARITGTFVDFWSKNFLPYGEPEGVIQNVDIVNNTIEITNDPSAVQIKSFFKLGARQQPTMVRFSGNVCRSYSTTSDTVLALLIVGSDQRQRADQIDISDNVCSGLVAGLVGYFNGSGSTDVTQNASRIRFRNNDLGYLAASAVGLQSRDVYLYGPAAGKVESLYLSGLQHPDSPLVVDAAGRARVYGKAIIPTAVTWNGITVGNGISSKKIAIDTDVGAATINARFTAGSTSAATGPIYPGFAGLTADSYGAAAAMHVKAGAAVALAAGIDQGASWVSLFGATGGSFGVAEFATSSVISVQAQFPCRYADV